jgi:hypothetical protein
MTLPALAAALAPLTRGALASDDPNVVKVGVVLCAIMGTIEDDVITPLDQVALDELAVLAGIICEHRSGFHDRLTEN